METFNFCPNSLVPKTIPRETPQVMSMNGWTFTAKPTTPHAHKFSVKLYGLKWILNSNGTFNTILEPTVNARALEEFYDRHETWQPFLWNHPHFGARLVRFAAPVNIPEGQTNGGGQIDPVEITLIEHDPGY